MKTSKFPIYITGERIFSNSEKAFELNSSKNLGEKSQGKIVYSDLEAFYLVESGKAELIKNKPLTEEQALTLFTKKKDFLTNYDVFKALKNKGYIVKNGSKFGAEFRIYENNIKTHAKWLVYPIKQSEKSNWNEFISKNRIAHSTAKKLLLAIVDAEDNVLFYEIDWIKT